MFVAFGLVRAGLIKYGLGIGADTSQGAPGDALEYSASAGAAAYIFGKDDVIATVDASYSYMTDTPDFWRREYQFYPRHGGRFTGEPAYFKHVLGAARGILDQTGLTAKDFKYVTFHQPNGKFPLRVGKMLGFEKDKIEQGWLVPKLGNTYSGASPLGLSAILDVAKPGDRILMVSYGSGAGSDAFVFTATKRLKEVQDMTFKTWDMLNNHKRYLEYGEYAKFRGKINKIQD